MDDSNNSELLSGHHSNQGDGGVQQHLSSLELENQLLKNEVASLNQEMTSIIQRAKDSQKGDNTNYCTFYCLLVDFSHL